MFTPQIKLTCQQAHQLLSQQMDQPLPWLSRTKLSLHLSACKACSRVRRHFQLLRLSTKQLGDK